MLRKMTVLTVSLLMLAIVATGAAAGTSRTERVETQEYMAGGANGLFGYGAKGRGIGTVWFEGGPERFVSVEIEDSSDTATWGRIVQYYDRDDAPDFEYDFCGGTEAPVRIRPRLEVSIVMFNGVCGSAPSLASTGTVTATFSR